VTASEAAQGQPTADESAMKADGFERVLGAGGGETTARQRAQKCREDRRNKNLINPQGENQRILENIHVWPDSR
jgi:hypothetical protein